MAEISLPEKNIYLFEMLFYGALMVLLGYFGFGLINKSFGNESLIFSLALLFIEYKLGEKVIDRFQAWKTRESNKEYAEYYEFQKLKLEMENIKLDTEIKKEQLKQLKINPTSKEEVKL